MTTHADGLIERLEKATCADRDLDLAISVAINFKGVFSEYEGWHWGAGGDEIEAPYVGRHGKPARAFLDPAQFVPRWTQFIDAALALVPDGWKLDILTERSDGIWLCTLWKTGPCIGNPPESKSGRSPTAALAVCRASLRARQSQSAYSTGALTMTIARKRVHMATGAQKLKRLQTSRTIRDERTTE